MSNAILSGDLEALEQIVAVLFREGKITGVEIRKIIGAEAK